MTSDTNTATSSMPLVIPTKTQQITARLILRNDLGQIIQQWLIRQNKCTLGSSAGCNLRCELPEIAPYHALLVLGARQIFVRGLAPKLTRDGVRVNEILLTEENNSFEIAGHRFELSRGTPETLAESKRSPGRLKFTLARPFEISNRSNKAKPESTPPQITAAVRTQNDDRRVAVLLQSAMEPLECRLQNILEPLAELQAESRRQRELSQQLIAERGEFATTWLERESHLESVQAELPIQFNELSARQSAAMDIIGDRISDVTSQLSALEHIIASDREESTTRAEVSKLNEKSGVQATAIAQLQSGIISVSSAIQDLESRQQSARDEDSSWKKTVQNQLSALRDSVESIATSVEENATQSATAAQETAWRTEIQDQFGLLRDFAQKALERAQAAQLAAERVGSNVNDYLESHRRDTVADEDETAWRTDVQSQFARLRETLETISAQTQQRLTHPSLDVSPTFHTVKQAATQASLSAETALPNYATQRFLVEPKYDAIENDDVVAPDYLTFFNQHNTSNEDSENSIHSQIRPSTGARASDSYEETEADLLIEDAVGAIATDRDRDIALEMDELQIEAFPTPNPAPDLSNCLPANYFDEPDESVSESIGPTQLPSWWKEEINGSTEADYCHEEVANPHADIQMDDVGSEYLHESTPNLTVRETGPSKRETLPATEIDYAEAPALAVEEAAQHESGDYELFGMSVPGEQISSAGHYSMFQADEPEEVSEEFGEELATGQTNSELTAWQALPTPNQISAEEEEEETSVEDYMRNLLARMRGVPEDQVKIPGHSTTTSASNPTSAPPASQPGGSLKETVTQPESTPAISTIAAGEFGATTAKPFNPEEFIPRVTTPEQIRNLAAMRDLANSSARNAIHKSTKQRSITSVAIALCISCVGLTVGAVLIVINGLSMNIALIATVASFLVAVIWGYDATVSLKPLLQAGTVLKKETHSADTKAQASDDE